MSTTETAGRQRRLVRAWEIVRNGLPSLGRYRRYITAILPILACIWGLTFAYLALMPSSYRSEFSLILPGSGIGSSINVESIGQAQASASSPFSSSALSPTENYKQLLSADITLRAASRAAGEEEGSFPDPTIKLIDQTNLIQVSVDGPNPEQARRRAIALHIAFQAQLDTLRNDEAAQREETDLKFVEQLSLKVQETQRKLIEFQVRHGLATLEQFNSRIASVDELRARERDLRTQLREQSARAGNLSASLRSTPRSADTMMRLRGDPVFQELASRYAKSKAEADQIGATLGPQHGEMAQAAGERDELRKALVARGRELTGLGENALLNAADLQLSESRANLMQAMTIGQSQAAGVSAALAELRGDLARAQSQSPELIAQASELADLLRNQRVAEAVFSSAIARLDTNKQDPFASYPLVQVLAAPSLPNSPASPSTVLALAGAAAASILVFLAFGLAWLRQPIIARLLPNS